MCTAIKDGHYFGRNLDLEYGYGEQVVITPRNFPLPFRQEETIENHYAYIGMAVPNRQFPLYFDGINEHGLCIAGLDFPGNAYYAPLQETGINIAPFELIPWLLSQYRSVAEARSMLEKTTIADISYGDGFPQAPLHWLLADQTQSIVLEPRREGLSIYDNPVGVLANNPPFPYHLYHWARYQHLSATQDGHSFDDFSLPAYSGGMGAIGLPGDFSSASRFVKAAFVKQYARCNGEEADSVTQFFHILDAVAMPRGAIRSQEGEDVITRYSSCCSMEKGIYYYSTYENRRIRAVYLHHYELDSGLIQTFPLSDQQDFLFEN